VILKVTNSSYVLKPLKNPTLGVLVAVGGNISGWQTGLWSTKAKVCGGMHCTGVVMAVSLMIPSGHQAAPCHIYAFHKHGAQMVTVGSPVLMERKQNMRNKISPVVRNLPKGFSGIESPFES
jgi:hypothetical protein